MRQRLFAVIYMFIITLCFTSLVNAVKHFNQERIALNQEAKEKGIILDVLNIPFDQNIPPGQLIELFNNLLKTIQVKDNTVFVWYEPDRKTPKGYVFPVSGSCFWGQIYGIAAIDAGAERILGVNFYRHSETPGLGGRISEKWFREQFISLPLDPAGDDNKIFYLKRPGSGKKLNELDAITGATMTSQAVASFLNREILDFVKEIDSLRNRI